MISFLISSKKIYDVVIIGAGGAGLAACLNSLSRGLKVLVISKVHPLHSHTAAAQGGINAALGEISEDDWRWHMYDTIKGSDWLGDQDAIEILARNAKKAISQLENWGVHFDRNIDGRIEQKIYGGQRTHFGKGEMAKRVCSVADKTGNAILTALYQKAKDSGAEFLDYHYAMDLIMHEGKCSGVFVWDMNSGSLKSIYAKNLIIATGGYTQIYETATSSNLCSGDGNGLVFRAGLPLQDMEFVQFHPTAISEIGVLISEAARSAGGVLINNLGSRFMYDYAKDSLELASRDVVARAISEEIALGRGCGSAGNHVLLDLTHIDKDYIVKHLPGLIENCENFLQIDPATSKIPVAPACHYTMGGIPTDKYCHVVNKDSSIVEGLYAIGEAACISVHGANRLGCNSLLDLIVFAGVVVENLNLDREICCNMDSSLLESVDGKFGDSKFSTVAIKSNLKRIMNKNVGVFRSKEILDIAMAELDSLYHEMQNHKVSSRDLKWNNELLEYLDLENLMISARATIYAALMRRESRGAHYREDFPERNDDEFLYHSLITKCEESLLYSKRDVRFDSSNVGFFPPETRNY